MSKGYKPKRNKAKQKIKDEKYNQVMAGEDWLYGTMGFIEEDDRIQESSLVFRVVKRIRNFRT